METTLAIGDFVWISVIVIIFGGASGAIAGNIKGLEKKLTKLEGKLDALTELNGHRS